MSSDTGQQKGFNWNKLQSTIFLLPEMLPALLYSQLAISALQRDSARTLHKAYAGHIKQNMSGLTLVIPVIPILTLFETGKLVVSAQGWGPGNSTYSIIYCQTDKIVQLLRTRSSICTTV